MRPAGLPDASLSSRRHSRSCDRAARRPDARLPGPQARLPPAHPSLDSTAETDRCDPAGPGPCSTPRSALQAARPPRQKPLHDSAGKQKQPRRPANLDLPGQPDLSQSVQTTKNAWHPRQPHTPTLDQLKTPSRTTGKTPIDLKPSPSAHILSHKKQHNLTTLCTSFEETTARRATNPPDLQPPPHKPLPKLQPSSATTLHPPKHNFYKRIGLADVFKANENLPKKPPTEVVAHNPKPAPTGMPLRPDKRPTAKHSKKNSLSGHCALFGDTPTNRRDLRLPKPAQARDAQPQTPDPTPNPKPLRQHPDPTALPPKPNHPHLHAVFSRKSQVGSRPPSFACSPSRKTWSGPASKAAVGNKSFEVQNTLELNLNPNDRSCGDFQTHDSLLDRDDSVLVQEFLPQLLPEEDPASPEDAPDPESREAAESLFRQVTEKNFLARELCEKTRQLLAGGLQKEFKTTISYYSLNKLLATGTFGQVYLGQQVLTGEKVAVKVFSKQHASGNRQCLEAIENELAILKRLAAADGATANTVRFLEDFEVHHSRFFVSEFASKGNLLQWTAKLKDRSEDVLRPVFRDILLGVQQVHALGIVHRDLKPDNILVDKNERAKIADFGLAKHTGQNQRLSDLCGSPAYQAPETFDSQGYDGFEADVWSLGVLFYQTVYGEVPFVADKVEDLPEKLRRKKLAFPPSPEVSNKLKDLLNRLLQKEPARRASLHQALGHVWFEGLQPPADAQASPGPQSQQFARHFLALAGFPEKYLADSLEDRKHNHATACFRTLEARDF